jgi:hypothetical protein
MMDGGCHMLGSRSTLKFRYSEVFSIANYRLFSLFSSALLCERCFSATKQPIKGDDFGDTNASSRPIGRRQMFA